MPVSKLEIPYVCMPLSHVQDGASVFCIYSDGVKHYHCWITALFFDLAPSLDTHTHTQNPGSSNQSLFSDELPHSVAHRTWYNWAWPPSLFFLSCLRVVAILVLKWTSQIEESNRKHHSWKTPGFQYYHKWMCSFLLTDAWLNSMVPQ